MEEEKSGLDYIKNEFTHLKLESTLELNHSVDRVEQIGDSNLILVGSSIGNIYIYNIDDGKLIKTFSEHSQNWVNIKYFGNYKENHFISVCYDNLIKIWDINQQNSLKTIRLTNSSYQIQTLINFDNNSFVVVDQTGKIKLFYSSSSGFFDECKEFEFIKRLSRPDIKHFKSKEPYNLLAEIAQKEIFIFDLNTLKLLKAFSGGHTDDMTYIEYFKDELFLTSAKDKKIILWSLNQDKYIRKFSIHNSAVNCLAVFPRENLIYSSSDDKTFKALELIKNESSYQLNEIKIYETPIKYIRIFSLNKNEFIRLIGTNWDYQILSIYTFDTS